MGIMQTDENQDKRKKYFGMAGATFLSIFILLMIGNIAIDHSSKSVEAQQQAKEVRKQDRLKKMNEFKILDKDDLSIASDPDRTDSYSLDSNEDGKATYKFQAGKNISLKLSDYKYAKINHLNKGRSNIEMSLANKNEDHRIVTLYVFKNNKKYKTIDLEIKNGITSYVNKQNAKEEAQEKANQQKKEQATKKKKADEETESEGQDALVKAEEYATSQDLSKQGVYDQLTSSYGENFSAKAAQYAINHLKGIDWNQNALDKAKDYKDNEHLSKNEIYSQLTSSYGEKFTSSEAQYAVDNLY